MKEVKNNGDTPIIKTHFIASKGLRTRKLWVNAQTLGKRAQFRDQNNCVESAYMRILNEVKERFLKPRTIYFERIAGRTRMKVLCRCTAL